MAQCTHVVQARRKTRTYSLNHSWRLRLSIASAKPSTTSGRRRLYSVCDWRHLRYRRVPNEPRFNVTCHSSLIQLACRLTLIFRSVFVALIVKSCYNKCHQRFRCRLVGWYLLVAAKWHFQVNCQWYRTKAIALRRADQNRESMKEAVHP